MRYEYNLKTKKNYHYITVVTTIMKLTEMKLKPTSNTVLNEF